METAIPVSKKEICAFVLACKQLNIEYQSTKVSGEGFIVYEVIYKSLFDLFQLGSIFQINCKRYENRQKTVVAPANPVKNNTNPSPTEVNGTLNTITEQNRVSCSVA